MNINSHGYFTEISPCSTLMILLSNSPTVQEVPLQGEL